MKAIAAILSCVALLGVDISSAAQNLTWSKHTDPSRSTVDVPSSLAQVKSTDGSLTFRSKDGRASATLFTTTEERPGFPGNDPESDLAPTSADCDHLPPAYKAIKQNLSAYSCQKGANIEYWIARYNGSGNVTLHVEYPARDKAYWDKVVERMSGSMTQQVRHEVRP